MSFSQHFPALQVVIPLIAAPLAVLVRRGGLAFLVVTGASWASFVIAIALWLGCRDGTVVSYALGSWPPPWGIEYRVDRLSSFILMIVAGMAAITLPYSRASIEREIPRELHNLYLSLIHISEPTRPY